MAWPGVEIRTRDVEHFLPNGLAFVDVLPTPDGAYSLGATFLPARDRGSDDEFRDVVLVGRKTPEVILLHHLPSTRHQLLYGDADDRWVVWVEASVQPNFEDWQIYAFDRQSRALRLVASAAQGPDGKPVPTPNVQPKVDHGQAVWSSGTVGSPLGTHVDSFIADLTTGDVRVLAQESLGAAIAWPVAIVGRHSSAAVLGTRLVAINLATGAETDLHIENATYYAVTPNAVAWIDDSFQFIQIRELQSTSVRVVVDYRSQGQTGPRLQFLSMSERLLAWGQSGGAWAYDRKRNLVVRLATVEPFSFVYLKGTALEWLEGEKAGAPGPLTDLRMLETTSFPE
jgi:hypothetical protein